MRILLVLPLLAACAATPQQMAEQSNWDVCRYTMGGPHSRMAEAERQRRGLDCAPFYPAINAQLQRQNDAINQYRQSLQPAPMAPPPRPTSCRSYRVGNQVQTDCN
jgi:hypothetical protein